MGGLWMLGVVGLKPQLGTATTFETAVQAYNEWNEAVQRHVPPEKLLVFTTPGDEWNSLCSFLSISAGDCPSTRGEPYPKAKNDKDAMQRIIGFLIFLADHWWMIVTCLSGLL